MVQEAGADTLHLAFIQLFPTAEPTKGTIDRSALFPIQFPGFGALYVSHKGERFVSELERRDVVSQAEIATGGKVAWCVFNAQVFSKLTDQAEIDQFVKTGRVKAGKTLGELAQAMDVPADALQKAVETHNGFIRNKKDDQFGKPITDVMVPMTEGPDYAVGQWPSVHHCQGGVHGNNRLGGIPDATVFGRLAGATAAA